ncbi:hypothetical protein [Pseudalkalibacillus caeni]|uniref:VOC domain-containing protein n=1 Tax=Exobacillus caeni TaxID=2574798 RepID=A0A5R9FBF9_9BACL|nr:hypothetical protein [Pseudalkalibacillus caeni]TLS38223.1 hypothetical protein FCL54_06720 [Pseudalkalibacillus caeni]
MILFHYHFWTNRLEETESFYKGLGFNVIQRIAIKNGEAVSYNPPLSWEDFRNESPLFRIIELQKGKVNLTFGHGKRPIFDHIGFLVTNDEHESLVTFARGQQWGTEVGERRTFIHPPFRLRIELQTRQDVVAEDSELSIQKMDIMLKDRKGLDEFFKSFPVENVIHFRNGDTNHLLHVLFQGKVEKAATDPNDVKVTLINGA